MAPAPTLATCALTQSVALTRSISVLDGRLTLAWTGRGETTGAKALADDPTHWKVDLEADENRTLFALVDETFMMAPGRAPRAQGDAPSLDVAAAAYLRSRYATAAGKLSRVTIADPSVRAYAFEPDIVVTTGPTATASGNALVMSLLMEHPDATLIAVTFMVNGSLAKDPGCVQLAHHWASTVRPGPRRLQRSAPHKETFEIAGTRLVLQVPADTIFFAHANRASVIPLTGFEGDQGRLIVSGEDDSRLRRELGAPQDEGAAGKLLGQPTTWRGSGPVVKALASLPGKKGKLLEATMLALGPAKRVANEAMLRTIAESMEVAMAPEAGRP